MFGYSQVQILFFNVFFYHRINRQLTVERSKICFKKKLDDFSPHIFVALLLLPVFAQVASKIVMEVAGTKWEGVHINMQETELSSQVFRILMEHNHSTINLVNNMPQHGNTTVDVRNPAPVNRQVIPSIIHRVLYIPRGAGFLPSTVCNTKHTLYKMLAVHSTVLPLKAPLKNTQHVRWEIPKTSRWDLVVQRSYC